MAITATPVLHHTKSHGTTPTKMATNVTAQISPRTAERMTTSHWARITTGDRTRVMGALKAGTPAVKEGIMKEARGERLELGVGDGVYELGDGTEEVCETSDNGGAYVRLHLYCWRAIAEVSRLFEGAGFSIWRDGVGI